MLATPVLAMTLLLVGAERLFQVGIFDPALGGDPLLFQHLFWFYSHPAVYIMVLPAMGVVSEIIPCFARKRIFGYRFMAYAILGIASIGFLVWGHHMFVSGQSMYASLVFSLLSFLVAVPSAIKVFNWTATLYKGSIRFDAPMLYALGFVGLFTIGGLTGLFLAALALDVHLTDTYFVVAHFHYIMVGGTVMAYLGGAPLLVAEDHRPAVSRDAGRGIAAVLIFVGFNLTFFPQFLLGYRGMPRRYHAYPPEFQVLNVLSSAGAVDPRGRLPAAARLPRLVAAPRRARRRQPVGRDRARVADRARRRRSTTSTSSRAAPGRRLRLRPRGRRAPVARRRPPRHEAEALAMTRAPPRSPTPRERRAMPKRRCAARPPSSACGSSSPPRCCSSAACSFAYLLRPRALAGRLRRSPAATPTSCSARSIPRVLLTSSFAVALAVAAAEHDRRALDRRGCSGCTAALGVVFLAVKGIEYGTNGASTCSRAPASRSPRRRGAELFFVLYFLDDRPARGAPDDRHRPDGDLRRRATGTRAAGRGRRACRSRRSTGTSSTWSGSSSTRCSTSSSATHERRPIGQADSEPHFGADAARASPVAWLALLVLMLASLGSAYLRARRRQRGRRPGDRGGQGGDRRRLALHAAAPRVGR